jgi:hypothetical protein
MNHRRTTSILLTALALHVLISLTYIVYPQFLGKSRISELYKVYLLPGPFFGDDKIINSYSLTISWKKNGRWSEPISPPKQSFLEYTQTLNPQAIYRNRLERALYQGLFYASGIPTDSIRKKGEFITLTDYIGKRFVPKGADSVKLTILHRRARDFSMRLDTLTVITYR